MVNGPVAIDPSDLQGLGDHEIAEMVMKIIVDIAPREIHDWSMSSRLSEDLGLDSLASFEFLMAAEDCFGIKLSDDEILRLVTISDTVALIRRCVRDVVG